ncbi:hypothetical protein ACFSTC_13775 [Nonomuraea ferruginea]
MELLLLAPLAAELGERPLVVVPTGILHTLPWAALPCLRECPVTVAASARSWLAATRDPALVRTRRPPGPLVMTRPTGPPRTTSPEAAATPPAGLAGTPALGTTPPTAPPEAGITPPAAPPEAGTTPPTALPEAGTTPPAGIPGAGHSDGVVLSGGRASGRLFSRFLGGAFWRLRAGVAQGGCGGGAGAGARVRGEGPGGGLPSGGATGGRPARRGAGRAGHL